MNNKQLGVTLIELISVIVIFSLIMSVISPMIAQPLTRYWQQNEQVQLIRDNQHALDLISNDIQSAIQSSIQISNNGQAMAYTIFEDYVYLQTNNNNSEKSLTMISQRDLLAKVSFKTIADHRFHTFCLNAS